MRKVFWCCLAGGAAVCCAFWAAAYVLQNPDSPLGRYAQSAGRDGGDAHPSNQAGLSGTADADDLIPADPVPVDDPPPLPAPGSHLPSAVAALVPPIIIHDEEDLNVSSGPVPKAPAAFPGDGDEVRPAAGSCRPGVPALMPYCADEEPAPRMPRCDDDGTSGRAAGQASDAFALWMGFFAAPSQLRTDLSAGRCEEDAHYGQQYPGLPYTIQQVRAEEPARADLRPLAPLPSADEPPAPKNADPTNLFSRPHPLSMPKSSEPQSDTMEMRPSDWKPYSLDPGPF